MFANRAWNLYQYLDKFIPIGIAFSDAGFMLLLADLLQ